MLWIQITLLPIVLFKYSGASRVDHKEMEEITDVTLEDLQNTGIHPSRVLTRVN